MAEGQAMSEENDVVAKRRFPWLSDEAADCVQVDDGFLAACAAHWEMDITGEPELVLHAIARYLRFLSTVKAEDRHARLQTGGDCAEADRTIMAMAAHLADVGNLVEVGISLRCAWVTENGERWLQNFEEWAC